MHRRYRPLLLAFIAFLAHSLTYGQDNGLNLNCGSFCLAFEATCSCTLRIGSLTWEVRDANGAVVGRRTVHEEDLNRPTVLFGDDFDSASSFGITVIQSTPGIFISEMSFDALPKYEGYEVECIAGGEVSVRVINIPGSLAVADLNLTTVTTDSVLLTFESPNSGDCLASYIVTTDAFALSFAKDPPVRISRWPLVAEDTTYFVCVYAVDTLGRTGPPSCVDCFRFSPTPVNNISYTYTMLNDGCAANIEWTPDSCLPLPTSYNVTINSSGEVTTSAVPNATFQIASVSFEELYTVTVIPSNSFSLGAPTTINFTTPMICPETSSSASASLLFPDSGVSPVRVIAGVIVSFGISAFMLPPNVYNWA